MLKELEKLINELDRGDKNRDDFDDIVLAEILWLAHSTREFKKAKKEKSPSTFLKWLKDWLNSFRTKSNGQEKPDNKEPLVTKGSKKIKSSTAPLTLNSNSSKSKHKIRVPKKRDYFITRELIEALSLLQKPYHSFNSGDEVDEISTVDYYARTNILKPHFKSKEENYFDLYIMVDCSHSMQIWQESIERFVEQLRIFGYFRTLKLFYVDTNEPEAVVYSNKNRTNRVSFSFSNHEKRSLLFVMSDCISPAWRRGEFLYRLSEYQRKVPTMLINMLPKRMWRGTILGNTNITKLYNPKKELHGHLIESEIDDDYEGEALLKLPIVNLNIDDFYGLSHFIVGSKNNHCVGLVASKEEIFFVDEEEKNRSLSSQERVERFFENSSPLAHDLALYFSVTTHLNFEIMKMIQHNMLPQSEQVHLAEVFVGGLLNKDSNNRFYMFMTDSNEISVRDILLDKLGSYRAMATLQKNSEFIAQNLGSSLDFMALLHSDFQEQEWSEADRAFANIARSVLEKVGGDYATIASAITEQMEEEESDEPELTLITPTLKRFQMGSKKEDKEADDREKPLHEVIINYDFEMAQTPVTVGEFRIFVEETDYKTEAETDGGAYVWNDEKKAWETKKDANWKNPYFEQTDDHPVVCVSWNDAQAYIKWLNEKTGETYRLPTEAEWEFSCRAGTDTKWHFGDDEKELDEYAWYGRKEGDRTKPVATKKPNQWGLYDMYGNVLEWCLDDFEDNYNNTPTDGSGHTIEEKKYKSLRGSSWNDFASSTRSAYRDWYNPSNRVDDVGFRLLRTLL
jgi:formylglycine-generating enzyme required for sulfatase activity